MSIAIEDIDALDQTAIEGLQGSYEFLDGRHVEKPPMGARANTVAFNLMALLWLHVRGSRLGFCFADHTPYKIFADDPNRSRIPDGSFIRRERLPDGIVPEGTLTIAPDIAIEVISPNDSAVNVNERVVDLLRGGVRLLWVVDPKTKQVHVYRADGSVIVLKADDELNGEEVVPGFAYRVADLFDAI